MTSARLRRSQRADLGRVLALCTAGRALDGRAATLRSLGPAAAEPLLVAASRHGVTGFVSRTVLALTDLDPTLREEVTAAGNRVVRDHLRAVGELAELRQALGSLPWMCLKGPVLASVTYRQPPLREYTDLDVLVTPQGLPATLNALSTAGYRNVDRDWAALTAERAGQVRLQSPRGVPIDLHWELVNDWQVRTAFAIPSAAALFERARVVDVSGVEVHTLDPVDTLLHVAVHACTSGGWRLLWLKDVAEAQAACRADPLEVAARARTWQVELVLVAMAERAQRVLGGAVAASPRGRVAWLRGLAALDRLAPVERATGGPSFSRMVTNSTRTASADSASELARRSARSAAGAWRTGRSRLPHRSSRV